MSVEKINCLVVGGGQAGLAISEHLANNNIKHIILEKNRIAEKWRTARWDSLVANGPAWHDRFPTLQFENVNDDEFPHKDEVVKYFEKFAKQINAPIKCNANVSKITKKENKFYAETSIGKFEADNVVIATGPFQYPIIPNIINDDEVNQIHSYDYKNPEQFEDGGVLVVGAGSSGVQIAEELCKSGKKTFLSVGPHDRPPRKYRNKDFVWWLGVLGKWEMTTPEPNTEHVTIAVSGADGGKTIDFRRLAESGITLVGMTKEFENGKLKFENDLKENIEKGDQNYLSLLKEADQYIQDNNIDLPEEPMAHEIGENPECVKNPILEIDLKKENIKNIIWATGYKSDFEWIKIDAFDKTGKPIHNKGVSKEPNLFFIGLPWLSMRGSSFIWGVWKDAKYIAEYISENKNKGN